VINNEYCATYLELIHLLGTKNQSNKKGVLKLDLIALILFIVVIAVSFLKKTNAGILAFAIGAIAVRIFSLTDKDLIGAISTSMFSILVGITLLL